MFPRKLTNGNPDMTGKNFTSDHISMKIPKGDQRPTEQRDRQRNEGRRDRGKRLPHKAQKEQGWKDFTFCTSDYMAKTTFKKICRRTLYACQTLHIKPSSPPPPLFFVAVKTNVDYQIVVSFVTHDETTESITEALGVLRQWNPGWSAGYLFHRSLRTGNQCYREYLKSCDSFTVSCFQISFNGKGKLYTASLAYKFSGKSLMLNKK